MAPPVSLHLGQPAPRLLSSPSSSRRPSLLPLPLPLPSRTFRRRHLALLIAFFLLLLVTLYSLLWSGSFTSSIFSTPSVQSVHSPSPETSSSSTSTPSVQSIPSVQSVQSVQWNGTSRCSEGCWASGHGTCHEEFARCDCLSQYTGPECTELAMPSCQVAPGHVAVCQVAASCACGLECDRFRIPHRQPCFDERGGGEMAWGGVGRGELEEEDLREIYDKPQVILVTDMAGSELERRAVGEWERLPLNYTHPEKCGDMCHGRGGCVRETLDCDCVWGLAAPTCRVPVWPSLFTCHGNCGSASLPSSPIHPSNASTPSPPTANTTNTADIANIGTSGSVGGSGGRGGSGGGSGGAKGECHGHVCRCKRGYYGTDCGLTRGEGGETVRVSLPPYLWTDAVPHYPPLSPASSPSPSPPLSPLMYVYELPGEFNTWQFDHWPGLDWPEELIFMERMWGSPYRTLKGEEAHFFYVPLILRNRNEMKEPLIKWVIEYIGTHWPYYDRKNGADHLFLTNGDWGNCETSVQGEGDPILFKSITISLWGHTRNMMLEKGNKTSLPCFVKGKDIVMPPFLDPSIFEWSPYLKNKSQPLVSRDTFLFFMGWSARESGFHGDYSWSFGVRQKMYELYEGKEKETGIVLIEKAPHFLYFLEGMSKSVFCLAPNGWGWGIRATQAVILGCIPVVIQPNVIQPLEFDLLDWSEFSVILTYDDIPNIEKILREISEEEIQKKRKVMSDVWMRFTWSSPQYNPFSLLPKSVQDKFAPQLVEKDAHVSIMEALARRLELKTEPDLDFLREAEEKEIEKQKKEREEVVGDGKLSKQQGESKQGGGEVKPSKQEGDTKLFQGPSKCEEGCWEHGTCNEDLGICQCRINYAGPTCEDFAMPGCHLFKDSPESFIPCNLPSSCTCFAQCAKHFLQYTHTYSPQYEQVCYSDIKEDGTIIKDSMSLYGSSQVRLVMNSSWDEVSRVPVIPADFQDGIWISPEECPDKCSGRGACQLLEDRHEKICHCPWVYGGISCEGPGGVPFFCFNDCSNHGTCFDGACKCERGFFGIDCSLYRDIDGITRTLLRSPLPWSKAVEIPPPETVFYPKVYVYELPGYMNTWAYQHSPWVDWPEQFYFLERILASGHRTANPEEADFFFIPLVHRNRGGMKFPLIVAAVEYVQKTYPTFWKKYKGRNHFILENDDWGICELGFNYGFADPFFEKLIVVTLWGHTRNMLLEKENPCFRTGKDIVMPPVMIPTVYPSIPYVNPKPSWKNRTILLYFKGWDATSSNPFGPYTWSFNVRQEMFKRYKDKYEETGILLEGTKEFTYVNNFVEQMTKSIFCFAPSGWGWGMRTTQAAMLGCVPVVLQPSVVQAYEGELLNWEDFSVVLKFEDIANISQILRSIPQKVIDKKRAHCAKVWTRFVWTSPSLNPFSSYPKEVQDEWAPLLAKKDVLSSVMSVLGKRAKRKTDRKTWLGGAPVEKIEKVKFSSDLSAG